MLIPSICINLQICPGIGWIGCLIVYSNSQHTLTASYYCLKYAANNVSARSEEVRGISPRVDGTFIHRGPCDNIHYCRACNRKGNGSYSLNSKIAHRFRFTMDTYITYQLNSRRSLTLIFIRPLAHCCLKTPRF